MVIHNEKLLFLKTGLRFILSKVYLNIIDLKIFYSENFEKHDAVRRKKTEE